jgi:hypothetical protein
MVIISKPLVTMILEYAHDSKLLVTWTLKHGHNFKTLCTCYKFIFTMFSFYLIMIYMFLMIVNDLLTNVKFIALCHDHLSEAQRKEV